MGRKSRDSFDMFLQDRGHVSVIMPSPSTLRDSTQIVLPEETYDGLEIDLEEQFVVTVVREDACRIIGSPVEIKAVSECLARHGIALP